VIVGEFGRAFSARQFLRVASTPARHGIQVWLPEADGPVDPAHRALERRRNARWCGRGTGRWRRCGRRRWSRAASWAGGRRMDIGWWTPGPGRVPRSSGSRGDRLGESRGQIVRAAGGSVLDSIDEDPPWSDGMTPGRRSLERTPTGRMSGSTSASPRISRGRGRAGSYGVTVCGT